MTRSGKYLSAPLADFWRAAWLAKYLAPGSCIAGGCFKDALSGKPVKDVDMFFRDEESFSAAFYAMQEHGWTPKYSNAKCVALEKPGEKLWAELVRSEFGSPEEILDSFDFTVVKMALYAKDDGYEVLYSPLFFEHLFMKRLVIDGALPFPVSTWKRTYRYKKYGFSMCLETEKRLLEALRGADPGDVGLYANGWD